MSSWNRQAASISMADRLRRICPRPDAPMRSRARNLQEVPSELLDY
jgi:hypothetical protein